MFIDPAEELFLVDKKLATELPYSLVEAIAVAIEQQLPDGLLLERGGSQAQLLHKFRFHDLRHSAASHLAMSGASLAEIAEILGHKTFTMVKRYAHLSDQHTAAVVSRMNEKFLGH